MNLPLLRQARCLAAFSLVAAATAATQPLVIDPDMHTLGGKSGAGARSRLDLAFTARSNAGPAMLFIHQREAKQPWRVELNGRRIGQLSPDAGDAIADFQLEPGSLREGSNTLAVVSTNASNSIQAGEVQLDPRPPEAVFNDVRLQIDIIDEETEKPLPARLTLTDSTGALLPFRPAPGQTGVVTRAGTAYLAGGRVQIGLRPGEVILWVSRGFEYAIRAQPLLLVAGQEFPLRLPLRHEVPTPGMVGCDPHVHTRTHSGHGDATVGERVITLAGEGVELPVITEHDKRTDLAEAARQAGVAGYFTTIPGVEVTTQRGHFNIFPVDAGAALPNPATTNWAALQRAIRATSGVKVAMLNHPRSLHTGFQPFSPATFDAVTGAARPEAQLGFDFDAVEVLNSSALQPDLQIALRDWMALLNRGHRLTAMAASDSHDVSLWTVGLGRSYVIVGDGADANPGAIDVGRACEAIREGRVLVCLGLLTTLRVNNRFGVGDIATGVGDLVRVTAHVSGPSWVTADRVELFANGVKIREQLIESPIGPVDKTEVTWMIPRPANDASLVAIASGHTSGPPDGPKASLPARQVYPRALGATNPVWLDADGDGRFTCALDLARPVFQAAAGDAAGLISRLDRFDEAVAIQAAGLCREAGLDLQSPAFNSALKKALPHVQRGFAAVMKP